MRIRIVVADDHELVRRGLRAVLESHPGWKVCGEAVDGLEAVQKAMRLRPDVVIMDMSMPRLSGLEATRQILKTLPKTEVVILSVHEPEGVLQEVRDAGAHAYVLKSDAARNLVAAVKAVSAHRPFFPTRAAQRVAEPYGIVSGRRKQQQASSERLTPREKEVLQLLAEGNANKQVALSLDISVKTAQAHRANVMHKLGLDSISDLVRYAIRNQLIQP